MKIGNIDVKNAFWTSQSNMESYRRTHLLYTVLAKKIPHFVDKIWIH